MPFTTAAVFFAALFATCATPGAVHVDAQFAPPSAFVPPKAITYDMQKVPADARAVVDKFEGPGGTHVTFRVSGLLPNREYGAHVHTKPCGTKPDDSGPHYQHRKDPHQPSTDPAYANPRNEVWLDFTTDKHGNARAHSDVRWKFRDGEARSLVVHNEHTHTGPGEAGTAGARLGCVQVPFG
ncbi:superoxide dismutase family protein [Streptomyces rectiverticillatus]|uniref:superoxide dismutase family protein n=1 Tax=Streptomyces rectiverticillatus TaxID=173860 RepID=UPI0015C3E7D4|nr:superoxide dismutase family protein [Streptomyces rectiverticillatus]QLE70270.1 superoxide dismutase family protein [Streptomyces rectiverticillatus]